MSKFSYDLLTFYSYYFFNLWKEDKKEKTFFFKRQKCKYSAGHVAVKAGLEGCIKRNEQGFFILYVQHITI